MSDTTKRFQLPSPEEVRAFELAAKRAQMEELRRLASAAARATMAFIVRTASALRAKLRRHAGGGVAGHGA